MDKIELLTDDQINALAFEQAIERLENIVDRLESGNVPLEIAIDLFQEGMKLAKRCHKKLENIELKIETLLEEDGEIIKKPFEYEELHKE
ncbi:exodeoxyribonuclease VII small subunit [Vulcanibacillus modesticaldus]|uniref:Exodeoxyribonuclease 7 small subunit n=1 Tax=Vulcanibacillus modesticaldus TaxID=337097 RepID=A0A1D2YRU3_9BACI|nr:exodeoxyribonuclease VII small subunit [Vulcanibacillus modesticaldus]OEF95523.1 exodeoxyribonuclease VII small subunit [Vulcanibacillus modesticaldus]